MTSRVAVSADAALQLQHAARGTPKPPWARTSQLYSTPLLSVMG